MFYREDSPRTMLPILLLPLSWGSPTSPAHMPGEAEGPEMHFPKVYSIPSSADNTSKSKGCWRTSALAPRAAPSHIPIILQNSLHAHSHTHQPSTSHPPEAQPDLGRVPTAPCVRPPPPSTAQHSRTQGTDGCSSIQQGLVFIDRSFSPITTHRAPHHPIETA